MNITMTRLAWILLAVIALFVVQLAIAWVRTWA